MASADHIRVLEVLGLQVTVDDQLGKLCVAHHGHLSWDHLQEIKNTVWGEDARAIEAFPRAADVVNNGCYRHLWRLGKRDFCPDLLDYNPPNSGPCDDTLEFRSFSAWREAKQALPGQARVWRQSGSEFK